jgi:hypothetical protein
VLVLVLVLVLVPVLVPVLVLLLLTVLDDMDDAEEVTVVVHLSHGQSQLPD